MSGGSLWEHSGRNHQVQSQGRQRQFCCPLLYLDYWIQFCFQALTKLAQVPFSRKCATHWRHTVSEFSFSAFDSCSLFSACKTLT